MNIHAQQLGRLGGSANKGKPKSEAHKAKLVAILHKANEIRKQIAIYKSKVNSSTKSKA